MKNEEKRRDLKRLVPLLVIIMLGMSFITVQHVSAVKGEIKAYEMDLDNLPVKQIDKDYSINNGNGLSLAATLHFNGGGKQWFRYINCVITNSQGYIMYNETKITIPGIANYYIDSRDWSSGIYYVNFNYEGNSTDGIFRAEKNLTLHIV